MILHTTEVQPTKDYRLFVRFNNGKSGEVDLSGELDGEVFGPLRGKKLFATAHHHPIYRTATWSNSADLCPEFLYELLRIQNKLAA
jgi:hypothetical protein